MTNFLMSPYILHLGQMNTLKQSPTINKVRGSLYQAVLFTGFLRCGIYGNISNITIFQPNSSQISIRDKNGYEVVDSVDIESKGTYISLPDLML